MEINEIRALIKETEIKRQFCSNLLLRNHLKMNLKKIRQARTVLPKENTDQLCWLEDNYDFFQSVSVSIDWKRCQIRTGFLSILKKIVNLDSFSGNKEDLFVILDEVNRQESFDENEILSIRSAFLLALFSEISESIQKNPAQIPHLIRCLHVVFRIDFSKIVIHFSPLEKIFLSDPVGIYREMTKNTKEQYHRFIKRMARKERVSSVKLAKSLLLRAQKDRRHIGFYLNRENVRFPYFSVMSAVSLLLSALLYFYIKSLFLSFFSIPILYFFVKTAVDHFLPRMLKEEALPAMKCEVVGEAEKSAVVITALIFSESDVQNQIKKLIRYRANNKSENDHLYFGLICDLPQSKKPTDPSDQKIIMAIEREIARANEIDRCFFALLRNRVYHKSENAYVGWERKRGAIEQFVDFAREGRLKKGHSFFGEMGVCGAKYLITLDSDTELGIGQAKRLIGKMIHPLNKAKIVKSPNGRSVVSSGYGILQPKVATSLFNLITTPYAKIFSNGSGKIPYTGASFDSMQTLYSEGNFCGKGIIDLNAYHMILRGELPEQKVLSHDMLEGALLRCGVASDEFFMDSDPQTSISYDKRQHRWIRGDVQNIPFFAFLSKTRKLFAWENLLRYLIPSIEFLVLFVSSFISKKLATFSGCIVLIYEFFPLVLDVISYVCSGNFQLFGRRFRTKMRNQLLNSFYRCFLSLSGIAHRAYFFIDAIIRSLFRMIVSKRNLLEWQTYSPVSDSKKDPLLFYLPSLFLSILVLLFSNTVVVLLISLLFSVYPFLMLGISQKYVETDVLTAEDKERLKSIAKKEYMFFERMVTEESSFLPPDNIQFEPVEKVANRTSPTNIGMYLVSLISAVDLEIISCEKCLLLLEKAFDHIEKLEHFHGHLYNWYDLSTLGIIGERFISTVDSGNYVASLIVVSQALKEWENTCNCKELRERIEAEITNADFKVLFDRNENLFFVGIFTEEKRNDVSYYDLYMSEARITSYLAIALGQISPSHWHTPSRPILSCGGRVGVGSWTGTCFEYFMAPLFLPIIENSLDDESLDFAYFCQKKYPAKHGHGQLYGISESGHLQTDPAGNLQYMAFGVPTLSVVDRLLDKKVFSPYSTFLMLQKSGKAAFQNLKNFEMHGAFGPMGFYEAVEYSSNFIDDYGVVKSYMAHHKGMSFLSIANALCDNKNVRRFLSREGFSEKAELLAERFPIEGKIYHKKTSRKESLKIPAFGKVARRNVNTNVEQIKIFSDGRTSLLFRKDGTNQVKHNSLDILNPKSCGFRCRVFCENDLLFDSHSMKDVRVYTSAEGAEQILIKKKSSILLKSSVLYGKNALFLRAEINGVAEKCRVEIDFDLMLQNANEYFSHPAFHNLSLEGCSDGSVLVLRKRDVCANKDICLYSNQPFKTVFCDFEAEKFDWRMLYDPKVRMVFEFESGKNLIIPIIISFDNDRNLLCEGLFDGSFCFSEVMKQISAQKNKRLNEICVSSSASDAVLSEMLTQLSVKQKIFRGKSQSFGKEALWKYGISGDHPIVSVFLNDANKRELQKAGLYISAFKKAFISGLCTFDLVFLHQKGDGYFDKCRDELSNLLERYQCEFLIGKHPGIHCVPCDKEDVDFWYAVSSQIIGDDQQSLCRLIPNCHLNPILESFDQKSEVNAVGKFLTNGFELNKMQYNPAVPFSHVISDRRLGFVCNQNSLGFTWYRNAGLNRITKWCNLPTENDGEKIFLEYGGDCYDLLQSAHLIRYQGKCAIYKGVLFGEEYSVIATVLRGLSVKCVSVLLSKKFKTSRLIYSFVPALGKNPDRNLYVDETEKCYLLRPVVYDEYHDAAFISEKDMKLNVSMHGDRICFSKDATEENVFFLGGVSSQEHLRFLLQQIKGRAEDLVIDAVSEENAKERKPPLEFWLNHQVTASRFFGRTGQYQSSGAYGFRDQLQDCLSFLDRNPELVKIHLLRCAAHQFSQGDVLHWWHQIRSNGRWDSGVRTRCSDDYLWLLYGVDRYIENTKDYDILSLKIPFLQGENLKDDESERYFAPEIAESASLLEHMIRAAKLFINRGLAENQLPNIGCGDWNDGMNRVDGESVWLGFFGAICLNRSKKYFDSDLNKNIDAFLNELHEGLEKSYNGVWFARAYRKNGQVLGSDISMESECSIDLITQAFAAFYYLEFRGTSNLLDAANVEKALDSAFSNLVDEKHRIVKLFEKAFVHLEPSPGYIRRYCVGVRENGGQYTHAAVWFAMALLKFGRATNDPKLIEKARIVTEILDPGPNVKIDRFRTYQREPYVLCGDVYSARGFRGRGGWSWYTGAAAWYLQLLKEWKKQNEHEKRGI